ncbi:MAG: ABC transporter substrate-binding protein [Candidatus Binatia bacterium]
MIRKRKVWHEGRSIFLCIFAGLLLVPVVFIKGTALGGPVEGNPRRGGTLIIALGSDPTTLNCGIESSQIVATVAAQMYSGLIHMDKESSPHPELAKSWNISADGLTYTFHLRDDVKWQDGEALTSADVKFSLEKLVGKYNARARAAYRKIKSVEAPDRYTVIVRLKQPYSPLMKVLTAHDGCIMPRHIYQGTDVLMNPHNMKDPIGTGPFKFKEWVKGDHITLIRNKNYFKKGRPFLDRVIFKVIPNAASRAIAFETGEVDMIVGSISFPYQAVDRLRKLPNIRLVDLGTPSVIGPHFNYIDNPILAKRKVRMAVAHAIDKKFIVDKGFRGIGKVIDSIIPAGIPWAYNPNVPKYPYNIEKANRLLDEAGYPRKGSGMRFSLRLAFESGNVNSERPAEIIREQLKRVGIDIKLDRLERSVMLTKIFKKYDFDMWWGPLTTKGHPALGVARLYISGNIRPRPFTNFTRYRNPRVDKLFDLAVATPKREEMVKAYHKVQEIIMRDLPMVPVADRQSLNIIRDEFRGGITSPDTFERMDEIWWTKGKPLKQGEFDRGLH